MISHTHNNNYSEPTKQEEQDKNYQALRKVIQLVPKNTLQTKRKVSYLRKWFSINILTEMHTHLIINNIYYRNKFLLNHYIVTIICKI